MMPAYFVFGWFLQAMLSLVCEAIGWAYFGVCFALALVNRALGSLCAAIHRRQLGRRSRCPS
jgi:mannose/fructose/N-acetylgalactosamine-specific phosphotransferase system component IIC